MILLNRVVLVCSQNKSDSLCRCNTNINSPGIVVLDDSQYKEFSLISETSSYISNTTEIYLQIKDKRWKKLSSIEDKSPTDEPILDHRWEKFINNHDNTSYIQSVLKSNLSHSVFLSVKIWDTIDWLNLTEKKWYHLKIQSSQIFLCDINNYLYNGTINCSKKVSKKNTSSHPFPFRIYIQSSSKNFWKLHLYNYLYTTIEFDSQLYTHPPNCSLSSSSTKCVHLHLAMCETCNLTLRINSRTKLIIGNGRWRNEQFCLQNLTGCFNLSVETKTKYVGFWALSDVLYVTDCLTPSCDENIRAILVDKYSNIYCENNINQKVNFTCYPKVTSNYNNQSKIEKPINKKTEYQEFMFLYVSIPIAIILIFFGAGLIFYFFVFKGLFLEMSPTKNYLKEGTYLIESGKIEDGISLAVTPQEFSGYVSKILRRGLIENQFFDLLDATSQSIQRDKRKPRIMKKNVVNRVKIKRSSIDANYLPGCTNYKEYIIAKSPLRKTVPNFWLMIWQKRIDHIVIISNKNENCVKYWPELYSDLSYKGINICSEEIQDYNWYCLRKLRVIFKGQIRQIKQWHYYEWDVDSLLSSRQIILSFIDSLMTVPHDLHPVLFHSLNDNDSIGTILLCDIVLRTSLVTGKIDVYSAAKRLREFQTHLLPTLEEYKLAHLIINDFLNIYRSAD